MRPVAQFVTDQQDSMGWMLIAIGIGLAFVSALFSASADDLNLKRAEVTYRHFRQTTAALAAFSAVVTAIGAFRQIGFPWQGAILAAGGLYLVAAIVLLLFLWRANSVARQSGALRSHKLLARHALYLSGILITRRFEPAPDDHDHRS